MDDQQLREALRPLARELLPPDQERRDAVIRSAFDVTGGVKSSALRQSLPPMMLVWYLPGAVAAANNVGAEIELTGDIRVTHLDVRAKTAPSGGECTVRLTANGVEVARASLPPGQTSGRSAVHAAASHRTAGEVLRVDVLTANGAADVTITVSYTVPQE